MFGNKFLLLIGHKKNDIQNRLINLLHKISIMEKSIKGTRTEQNLLKSFAGESQARSRYTFFASVAKKEGYEQIAGVFMETAEQEKEHAKRFFKFLEGGMVEQPLRTWQPRQLVRMRSGLNCILSSLRSQRKKVSPLSL